jgi:hypothetical protein
VSDLDAVRQELPVLRERMATIKEEVAAEVEQKWATPYRTPAVFDLKVNARLASHEEFRALQDRVRNAEAALAAEPAGGSGS